MSTEAPADDPLSSLVPLGQSVHEDTDPPTPEACRRVTWHWWCIETAELRPGRCRASFCDQCGPLEAWWKARIISHGGQGGPPQRYFVLTRFPPNWQLGRQKMRNLRRWGVERFGAFEQAWTVETNPRGTGLHVNVLQKGAYVPQAELQDRWGAIVHCQAIKSTPGAVGGYVMKEAARVAGYSLKSNLADHLAANGDRLVHVSRGYLGGHRQEDVRRALIGASGGQETWQRRPGRLL